MNNFEPRLCVTIQKIRKRKMRNRAATFVYTDQLRRDAKQTKFVWKQKRWESEFYFENSC